LFLCRKLFLLLRKSTKIVASRAAFITQIYLSFVPDPIGRAYSAAPNLLAVFRGAILLKRRRRAEKEEGKEKEGKGRASIKIMPKPKS